MSVKLLAAVLVLAAAGTASLSGAPDNVCAATLTCDAGLSVRHDEDNRIMRVERVGTYDSLTMMAVGNVYYTQSDNVTVRIIGPSSLVDDIDVDCSDGHLTIKRRLGKAGDSEVHDVKILLTAPALDYVNIGGIARFKADGTWNADRLTLVVDKVGDIDIDGLTCRTLSVSIDGVGEADIDVRCDSVATSIGGVGKIKLHGSAHHVSTRYTGIGKTYTKGLKITGGHDGHHRDE